jgi:hypothetical protein
MKINGGSMPLLPVYYTTTNLRKRKQTKHDRSEHDAWLIKMGVSPKQIKAKKTANKSWKSDYSNSLQVDRSTKHHEKSIQEVCNAPANATANRSVMANLHKESEETRKAILAKAARTAPLYSKGPYQYITDGTNLDDVGKKK